MRRTRQKRGLLGIASKIGKGGSKLLGLASGAGGEGGQTYGAASENSGQQSPLKERMRTDQQKMDEFEESNKDQETLKEEMSNLEITNDVSFDGFDEFKMADTRVEFQQEDR